MTEKSFEIRAWTDEDFAGEANATRAPLAASGAIEFDSTGGFAFGAAAYDADDVTFTAGAERRAAMQRAERKPRGMENASQRAPERKRVKTSFGAFAIDVDAAELPGALRAILAAMPDSANDLAESKESAVREALAGLSGLDECVIGKLARDASAAVRRALCGNDDAMARLDEEARQALRESIA